MEENASIYDLYNKRRDEASQAVKQSEEKLTNSKAQFNQYHNDYVTGKRNPLADIITKPQRDADREKRLKDVAKWSVIGDAIGLIGKGWAASKSVKPLPTEGKATFQALGKLEELDQLYRQEGYRYDQHRISEALRRQQAGDILQQFKLASAEQDYKQNQERLNNAQQNADAMAIRKDEQQRQDQRIKENREYDTEVLKEDREYKEKVNATEFSRQVGLINHRAALSSGGHSEKSDTLYHIKDAQGNDIPVNASLETNIIAEAVNKKIIVEGDELTLNNVKDSPQGRAKMQSLYQALTVDEAQSKINKMKEGFLRDIAQAAYNTENIGKKYPGVKLQKKTRRIENKELDGVATHFKSSGITDMSLRDFRNGASEFSDFSDAYLIEFFKDRGINIQK